MVIVILICASGSMLPVKCAGGGLANGFHAQVLLSVQSSDVMHLRVPIMCVLLYAATFVDDHSYGTSRPQRKSKTTKRFED